MNDFKTNPYEITDDNGNPRFSASDLRTSGGGCFLRRDAHTNPDVTPPFFLNEIRKWYLNEVSLKDEEGKTVQKMRGLYCTDRKYAGPVTCAACHTVNEKGIPVQLSGTEYYDDYWSSVVLIHLIRE
jgi:hypothetical protein